MAGFVNRMIGAAALDKGVYEEVEADKGALPQAAAVVVLASVAAGIGGVGDGARGFVSEALTALVGWCVWAFLIYTVGANLFPEPQTSANFGQLLRTIGFACSPGLLRAFGFIPLLGWLVLTVVSIWMLCTTVVAVRQALDFTSTPRAVGVCLVGWILYIVIVGIGKALF